jgi:hypothetical protein
MEEYWFRIKGIYMMFRNKSTAFYVVSMVGKPLALDKSFPMKFKIGCRDTSLVPNTRIGEIKYGFYEFQFTRKLFEATPLIGTRTAVADVNQIADSDQGTPKRQRTSGNESKAGFVVFSSKIW